MKVVIVVNQTLPTGLLANTAAVLAFSVSRHIPGGVGEDTVDADGTVHAGITRVPIPVLSAHGSQMRSIVARAGSVSGVGYIDFTDAAQETTDYRAYADRLASTPGGDLRYLGICIFGEPGEVNRITGSLPLVR